MKDYVRVTARRMETSDYLYFDLRLEDDVPSSRLPSFGWQNNSGYSSPFVIQRDGVVDFGTCEPDRYGKTNILNKQVALGQDISWSGTDFDYIYKVVLIQTYKESI